MALAQTFDVGRVRDDVRLQVLLLLGEDLLPDALHLLVLVALHGAVEQRVVGDEVRFDVALHHLVEDLEGLLEVLLLGVALDERCVDDDVEGRVSLLLLEELEGLVDLSAADASVDEAPEGHFVELYFLVDHLMVHLEGQIDGLERAVALDHDAVGH